ncbi:MAG TPA: hypothetical protein VNX21_09705, partial [Candidatus Thermoplasmatota archaeon]|nr:hypothetical protein [Candidatus Thermoplasmatota archaeon]
MRAPAALLLALLACPLASACSLAPPPDHQRLVATGDGAVWGNLGWSIGEAWLENGTFRHVTHVPPLGRWALSPDARWLVVERSALTGGMCETTGHALEVRDLRTNQTRTQMEGRPGAFAVSARHLALARPDADAILLLDVETGDVARELRLGAGSPDAGGFEWYGPSWRANETWLLQFSPDGRRLASVGGELRASHAGERGQVGGDGAPLPVFHDLGRGEVEHVVGGAEASLLAQPRADGAVRIAVEAEEARPREAHLLARADRPARRAQRAPEAQARERVERAGHLALDAGARRACVRLETRGV